MGTVIAIVSVLVAIWATKYRTEKHIRYYIEESCDGDKNNKNKKNKDKKDKDKKDKDKKDKDEKNKDESRKQEKKKNYILTFWNSSKGTICDKDLYQFDLIVPEGSNVKVMYSNDQIPLNIGKEEDYTCEEGYKKLKLSVDFLPPNSGYILKIDTNQVAPKKIGLLGRLKGENKWSVDYYGMTYEKKLGKILDFINKPTDILQVIFSVLSIILFAFIGLVSAGAMIEGKIDEDVMQVYIYEALFVCCVAICVVLVLSIRDVFKYYKIPSKIKKALKENKSDYEIIKDEKKIFYYPTMDMGNKFIVEEIKKIACNVTVETKVK